MRERRALRGLPLAGMAGAGVVLGHWLAYAVALPNDHLRAEVLSDAGHAYWPLAIKAGLALMVAGLGALAVRIAGGSHAAEQRPSRLFISVAWRLGFAQLLAFSVLEISERLAVGAPLTDLSEHHLFVLGIAVQLAVAVIGSLLVVLFSGTVERILRALRARRERAVGSQALPPDPALIRRAVLAGPGAMRAPPSS